MNKLERFASRCVRGVPRDQRAELRQEILGHLEDLATEARRQGLSIRDARRHAVGSFGDRGRLRVDMARAARGKRVIQFPAGFRGWLRSVLIYDLPSLLVVLLLVVVLRAAVVGIYHIPTRSMEPTLIGRERGGDRIAVDMLTYRTLRRLGLRSVATDIRRWDVLVFRNEKAGENGENFIKRVGGLPGDALQVSHGDLFVNEKLATKPEDVREAMLIPLVRPASGEADLIHREWTRTGGTWTVEPRRLAVTATEDEPATLAYPRSLRTWYIDHQGERQGLAQMDVLDFRFSADVTWREGAGDVRIIAGQEGHEVELRVAGEGSEQGAALRFGGVEVARLDGVTLRPSHETRLRISRLDGVVRAAVAGHRFEHDLDWTLERAQDFSIHACRARIEIRDGTASIREVRIERDVHYSRHGLLARGESYVVPEGRYFMMGDNSENSTDSRSERYGPFAEEDIIGRPHFVFWPPSRWGLVR